METCPCGSDVTYEKCCGPIHKGEAAAPTAEALMHARYSAFVKDDTAFLRSTIEPSQQAQFDEDSAHKWAKDSEWKGLEIVSTEKGGKDDDTGKVEFIARYTIDDKDMNHHEVAKFRKENGRWYFVDGRIVGVDPYVRDAPKVGRNDPCPCGSGKKFKKCCGK